METRDGHVRARALIALNMTEGIMTFYPYCNDNNINFRSLKEFVTRSRSKNGIP